MSLRRRNPNEDGELRPAAARARVLTRDTLVGIGLAAAALMMAYLFLSGTSSFGQVGSDAYGQCDPFCEDATETPSPTPPTVTGASRGGGSGILPGLALRFSTGVAPSPTPPPTPSPTQPPTPSPTQPPTPSPTQPPGTDLTIVKTGSPNPVMIDGVLAYTVTVNNVSAIAAEDVFVIDTLPSNVSLISSTPSQGSCEDTMCTLGLIIAGESAVISYVALVGEGAKSPIVNVVCVRSTFKSNNCDSEETELVAASSVFSTPNDVPVMGGWPLERGGSTGLSLLLVLGIGLVVAGAVTGFAASRRTTNE